MSQKDLQGSQSSGIDHTDPDTLHRLYWGEKKSISQIADMTNMSNHAVRNQMENHGINRRSDSRGAKIRLRKRHPEFRTGDFGYNLVISRCDGERSQVKLSRLLAVAEYGFDAVEGKHVHHKNKIPWDDRPENIELLEPSEHAEHHSRGEANNRAKLTEADVKEVKRLLSETDMSQTEIGKRFGIKQAAVSSIKLGENWGWVEQ